MLNCSDPNTLLLQMGAFAQIYTGQPWRPWWPCLVECRLIHADSESENSADSGGKLKACRHAVLGQVPVVDLAADF